MYEEKYSDWFQTASECNNSLLEIVIDIISILTYKLDLDLEKFAFLDI